MYFLSLLLFLTPLFGLSHDLLFEYGQKEVFWEQLDDNDTQLTIELNVTHPENAAIKYRILQPGQNQMYQAVPGKMVPIRLTGKGVYGIDVCNFDNSPVLFKLNTFVDKDVDPDENTVYIRNVLEKMKTDLRNLYNGSMQLSQDKRHVLSQARSGRTKLMWLCVLPLGYVIVGIVKYKMMKNMFMPKRR